MTRFRSVPEGGSPDLDDALRVLTRSAPELGLPTSALENLAANYLSLCHHIDDRRRAFHRPLVVGISGAQGSGKTTFRRAAEHLLSELLGRRTVGFSIDDLYLGAAERRELARHTHPLFITRGVPGTHDVELGLDLLRRLKAASGKVAVPAFDKGTDDRYPHHEWPLVDTPADVILLDGWCVGVPPQGDVSTPINRLETEEDEHGTWRRRVEQALRGPYADLFASIDELIFLQVPSWDAVHRWRRLQESDLRRRRPDAPALMDDAELDRFLMHYERLTRHALDVLPGRANVVCRLDDAHCITEILFQDLGAEN